jgi:hypothetical protein
MSNTIEIRHLSREEKLRVIEVIWEDLSREDEQVESPDWHHEAFQETDQRLRSGKENIMGWHNAKREINYFNCTEINSESIGFRVASEFINPMEYFYGDKRKR